MLMLASGAFKTGETARACLFIYPFMVWPVAVLADRARTFGMAKQQALFTTLVIQPQSALLEPQAGGNLTAQWQ